MKAKCPHCIGDDRAEPCRKCNGTGFIEVTLAKGVEWMVVCSSLDCRFYNGGFIVGPGSPYKTIENRGEPGLCIKCGEKTEYKKSDDYGS
jgi:hypothetical protein